MPWCDGKELDRQDYLEFPDRSEEEDFELLEEALHEGYVNISHHGDVRRHECTVDDFAGATGVSHRRVEDWIVKRKLIEMTCDGNLVVF